MLDRLPLELCQIIASQLNSADLVQIVLSSRQLNRFYQPSLYAHIRLESSRQMRALHQSLKQDSGDHAEENAANEYFCNRNLRGQYVKSLTFDIHRGSFEQDCTVIDSITMLLHELSASVNLHSSQANNNHNGLLIKIFGKSKWRGRFHFGMGDIVDDGFIVRLSNWCRQSIQRPVIIECYECPYLRLFKNNSN